MKNTLVKLWIIFGKRRWLHNQLKPYFRTYKTQYFRYCDDAYTLIGARLMCADTWWVQEKHIACTVNKMGVDSLAAQNRVVHVCVPMYMAADDLCFNRVSFDRYRFRLEWKILIKRTFRKMIRGSKQDGTMLKSIPCNWIIYHVVLWSFIMAEIWEQFFYSPIHIDFI